MQAVEAIKLVLGNAPDAGGRLLSYDAWTGRARTIAVSPRPECPACGAGPAA
jgi:hypothetical protein